MKKIHLVTVSFFLYTCSLAQDLQSLRVPSTPAFSILNFEPSSFLKPSSLKDFGGDVVNSFDENGKLKMNLGLELSPYWLSSRPSLSFERYTKPSVGQTILQTLNFSAATVRDSVNNKNKLGAGVRFQILNGKPDPAYLQLQKNLSSRLALQSIAIIGRQNVISGEITSLKSAKAFFTSFIDDAGSEFDSDDKLKLLDIFNSLIKNYTDANLKEFFEALNVQLNSENSPLVNKVMELAKKRHGFFLEFAAATGFSENKRKQSLERAGIWLTASNYYLTGDSWFINTRYQFSNRDTSQNNFDLGFSYAKELSNFSISAEGMLRWYRAEIPDLNINNQPIIRLDKNFTYRLALQATYLISSDISFNLSMGKDFDSPFLNGQGFFSIFGLNYSLFKKVKTTVPVKNEMQ